MSDKTSEVCKCITCNLTRQRDALQEKLDVVLATRCPSCGNTCTGVVDGKCILCWRVEVQKCEHEKEEKKKADETPFLDDGGNQVVCAYCREIILCGDGGVTTSKETGESFHMDSCWGHALEFRNYKQTEKTKQKRTLRRWHAAPCLDRHGALIGDYNVVRIKPFKEWKGNSFPSWEHYGGYPKHLADNRVNELNAMIDAEEEAEGED